MDVTKIYDIITHKLVTWVEGFFDMLPNFVVAILVFFLFVFIAKFILKKTHKISQKKIQNESLLYLIKRTFYIFILFIGCFVALSILNLDKTVTSILAGAGIIGLALGFAFQDIASNFIAGILMAAKKPFHKGDFIESTNYSGIVQNIGMRTTEIRSFQGQKVTVPNKEIFQNGLINNTVNKRKRIDLRVGISYSDDLDKVKEVALKAVENTPMRTNDEIKMVYTDFGASSIDFLLTIWVNYEGQWQYLESRSHAIVAIKKAFDQNDITIPFPIRTLDFGGKELPIK